MKTWHLLTPELIKALKLLKEIYCLLTRLFNNLLKPCFGEAGFVYPGGSMPRLKFHCSSLILDRTSVVAMFFYGAAFYLPSSAGEKGSPCYYKQLNQI